VATEPGAGTGWGGDGGEAEQNAERNRDISTGREQGDGLAMPPPNMALTGSFLGLPPQVPMEVRMQGQVNGRPRAVAPPAPVDPAAEEDPATASSGTPAPSASLMVTLAVSAAQAEAVVFGIEHGTLWLSLEPDGAQTGGTDVITPDTIYGKAFA
jgi:hypothetical protein